MEMKPGYKQTEVGVIPEEWEATSVGQMIADGLIEKPLDGNHGNIHPKSGDFVESGIPFVMANNVQDGRVDLVNCSFIRQKQADSLQKGFSRTGDVLLTHKATIGNTAIVGEIPFPYIMLTPQVTYYRVADKQKLSNIYLRYYFDSGGFQSVLRALSGGGTRAYIGISAQHQLPVIIPPNPAEQRAIAEALSDVDGLLNGLDRLIAKKRDLKQAAMQQLLTGQTRLPGFQGEWDFAELKSLYAKVFKKSPLSSADGRMLGAYPLFVSGGEAKRTDLALFQNTEALIISDGGVFDVKYFSGDFSVTDHCFVVSLKGDMRFYFQWMSLRKAELDLMTFKGSGLRNLDKPTFGKVEAPLPPPAEQTAIADVLTEMDAELAALEHRREKTRALKQAMMQELLTGKTRLVSTGEAHA